MLDTVVENKGDDRQEGNQFLVDSKFEIAMAKRTFDDFLPEFVETDRKLPGLGIRLLPLALEAGADPTLLAEEECMSIDEEEEALKGGTGGTGSKG